jgi:hypothetical protein
VIVEKAVSTATTIMDELKPCSKNYLAKMFTRTLFCVLSTLGMAKYNIAG